MTSFSKLLRIYIKNYAEYAAPDIKGEKVASFTTSGFNNHASFLRIVQRDIYFTSIILFLILFPPTQKPRFPTGPHVWWLYN